MRTVHSIAIVAAATATLAQAQPTYEVIDLGTMGGQYNEATDVNDAGQVVGIHTPPVWENVPFLWENGQSTSLRLPPDTGRSSAKAISETGLVVGWASPAGSFVPRPLTWEQGQYTDIGTLGGVDAGAMGVSPDGTCIVGWARPTNGAVPGNIGFRAFEFDGNEMDDLGTLPVGHWSDSYDANNAGQIVGSSGSKNDSAQATLFDPEMGAIDLGTLGGLGATARAINASGHVVGQSDTGSTAPTSNGDDRLVEHAFIWNEGVMTDLGVLPGDDTSWGMGLNDADVAVGASFDASSSPWVWRAWVWEQGQMSDLNTLIDPASGWILETANAINNNGWIVGRGQLNGQSHAYLLKPTP